MSKFRIGAASLQRLLGEWQSFQVGVPTYRQLADALRLLILDGRLGVGVQLPGERQIADTLSLSRTTLTSAFSILRDEGFLVSRHGSGTTSSIPVRARHQLSPKDPLESGENVIDMSIAALPANEMVHRAYSAAMAALPLYLPCTGYEPVGVRELRMAVAERYCARGVPTSPDEIMITHGAQHALTLVLRLLTKPGDAVLIDHPTYPLAIDAIRQALCEPVPVALPAEGWDCDALLSAFRRIRPRLAYFQPDFHNPGGRCMDEHSRQSIAAGAASTQTYVIADETMADLWLDSEPPAPLAYFDDANRVITLGSTGKNFWGGLRVGWIRADVLTIASLAKVRAPLDLGTPVLEQLAVAELLTEPAEAMSTRRSLLRRQRDHLIEITSALLPDWTLPKPPGGLSIWAELPWPAASALAVAAHREGVRVSAGPRFGINGAFERFIRLPFTLDCGSLDLALARLTNAWNNVQRKPDHLERVGADREVFPAVI